MKFKIILQRQDDNHTTESKDADGAIIIQTVIKAVAAITSRLQSKSLFDYVCLILEVIFFATNIEQNS